MMTQSTDFDELHADMETWKADQERTREEFERRQAEIVSEGRSLVTRLRAEANRSALPEYLILAALAGVCAVLIYFALKLLLSGDA